MRSLAALVFAGVLGTASLPAGAVGGAQGSLSGTAPAAGLPPETDAEAPAGRVPSFDDRVADFVARLYLSGEALTDEELSLLYASSVDYFDNRHWPRQRVLADKRAYYARWPRRGYRLIRETLRVTEQPGRPKVYDVRFDYTFDVASPGRSSRGRGTSHLTIDLSVEGGRITRETGTVTERW
ncbi:MAG: hypothetical protein SFW09_20555 [Hyphomicrobiaceae bacterium]|nr:hypothetical protein [Hyphomicrobiaceae bacterium]